ncbi:MAG: hypothetical protein AB1505_28420 [Candidatus Latescibacterota bacterium]
MRRTALLAPRVVKQIADSTRTTYVDSGLAGNTEYFYHVAVVTQQGHAAASEPRGGAFYRLVDTWPLEVPGMAHARLYTEAGDRIRALAAGTDAVRLLQFDPDGRILTDETLFENRLAEWVPRTVGTAVDARGRRLLSGVLAGSAVVLAPEQERAEREVFAGVPPDSIAALAREVAGEVWLRVMRGTAGFDDVAVYRAGELVLTDDFAAQAAGDWYASPATEFSDGWVWVVSYVSRKDESWRDLRVEADVALGRDCRAGVQVGRRTRNVALLLDSARHTAVLQWGHGGALPDTLASAPLDVLPGLAYRLGLEVVEGRIRASVQTRLWWRGPPDEACRWSSLLAVGDRLFLTADEQPYRLDEDGGSAALSRLPEAAGELRAWRRPGEPLYGWIGVCVPRTNELLCGRTNMAVGEVRWPLALAPRRLHPNLGQGPGEMLFPLSFAADAEGRLTVLDAGNHRIQVFDAEGRYVTQWGAKGAAAGEFDFGSGTSPEDFSGSVSVDSRGYVYVAEALNRRIQVFAP